MLVWEKNHVLNINTIFLDNLVRLIQDLVDSGPKNPRCTVDYTSDLTERETHEPTAVRFGQEPDANHSSILLIQFFKSDQF